MKLILRPYQEHSIERVRQQLIDKGGLSGILHLFTGAGKSAITTHIVDQLWNPHQGHRSLIIGGINRLLTFQMLENFHKHFPYLKGNWSGNGQLRPLSGIVMGTVNQSDARVIVASIQSLTAGVDLPGLSKASNPMSAPIELSDFDADRYGNIRRNSNSKRPFLISPRLDEMLGQGGLFDLWVHDEAHHAVADGSVYLVRCLQRIRQLLNLKPMRIIGNTATPSRSDERGLHTLFETILVSYGIPWGQAQGYLVPFAEPERVLIDTVEVDDDGNGSLIDERQTIRYVDNWAQIVANAYLEKLQGRRCFGYWSRYNGDSAIADSIWVTDVMNVNGIRAAHIDGEKCIDTDGRVLPKSAQGTLLQRLAAGQLDVINNFDVLTEGIDIPEVDAILQGRRIGADNMTLLTQMIGRGLRHAPNKKDLKIVDVTGQALVLNGLVDLMGVEVDPTAGLLVELDAQRVISDFIGLWSFNQAEVEKWILTQKRYSEATIRAIIERVLRGLDIDESGLKLLAACVRYLRDEDRLLEDADLRDSHGVGRIHGVNQTYELIKIVRKSDGFWYVDNDSALWSMSASEDDSFVIHPPNHTRSRLCELALEILVSDEQDHRLVRGKSPADRQKMATFFQAALELFQGFTLWHIKGKPFNAQIQGGKWILVDLDLVALENDALAYIRASVVNYTAAFADKKKARRWAGEQPTQAQLNLLASVLGMSAHALPTDYTTGTKQGGIGRGGVARLITHKVTTRLVEGVVHKFEEAVDRLKDVV